jgi:hypothetical protein
LMDRIGRFLYTIWPRLDLDSSEVLRRLPAVWEAIDNRWGRMPQVERYRATRFFKPIFSVYEELLVRPLT